MVTVKRYTASWCGPCKIIASFFEEFNQTFSGKGVNFITIDVDANQNQVRQDNINSVPCVIFYKNGNEVTRIIGGKPKFEYFNNINSLLDR